MIYINGYSNKTYAKRHERAKQLLFEALELEEETELKLIKHIINDAIFTLNGGDDKGFVITKSKETIQTLKEKRLNEFNKHLLKSELKTNQTTILKCPKCKTKHKIYKINEKWLFTCNCGQHLILEGKIISG